MENEFLGHVGGADIHDGRIINVEHQGEKAIVTIKTVSEQIKIIQLDGVKTVKSNKPIGMLLYSMAEMKHPDNRLFVFTNWEEEDEAFLEITAESFRVNYA